MGLPAQVQAQLDAAEALQAQLAQPQPAEAAVNTEAPAANTPEPTEPAPVAQPTEPAAPVEPKSDELAQLEQRYKSLQGMWQSSVARLNKAEQQNAELTEKLEQAIAKLEQAAAPATPSEPKPSSLVTDKDAEAFGTDLIDLARRVAKEQFGEREQQLLGQISKLEQRLAAQDAKLGTVAETQVATAQERFYAALDSGLAQWEALQATPECQAWLQTRVPGTRYTWNQALQTAAQDADAPRALEVFDTFLKAHPTLDPRKPPAAPASQSKRDELQRQVAPSKSAAAATAPQGKRTYTAREYEQAMNQVIQLGKMRQYDDQTALENELNAALAEGRVTP